MPRLLKEMGSFERQAMGEKRKAQTCEFPKKGNLIRLQTATQSFTTVFPAFTNFLNPAARAQNHFRFRAGNIVNLAPRAFVICAVHHDFHSPVAV